MRALIITILIILWSSLLSILLADVYISIFTDLPVTFTDDIPTLGTLVGLLIGIALILGELYGNSSS